MRECGHDVSPHRHEYAEAGIPYMNWVQIANGMRVEAAVASECTNLMKQSFKQDLPFLIELLI